MQATSATLDESYGNSEPQYPRVKTSDGNSEHPKKMFISATNASATSTTLSVFKESKLL
jgi:hypothetical protein